MFCFAFLRGNRRITFQGFDWSGLLERNLKPPMNPVIQSSTDTSNFDRYRLYTQSKHCHSWGLHNNLLHWIPFINVFGLAFYIFGISPLWSLTWLTDCPGSPQTPVFHSTRRADGTRISNEGQLFRVFSRCSRHNKKCPRVYWSKQIYIWITSDGFVRFVCRINAMSSSPMYVSQHEWDQNIFCYLLE